MRLWHQDMMDLLPKSQLLAQWRELNSVFAKEDRHILINYIYEYPKEHLYVYTQLVLQEMRERAIKIRTVDKMNHYFQDIDPTVNIEKPFHNHHNDTYFEICYFNLKEKYLRGQKDFEESRFQALDTRYKSVQARKDMV
ncbi:pyrimidine dimer DNA glycosylase/endonuclease V [Lysinibacillus sp. KU-BSD001]|uniref:pyrimidine dimer DNA glycosylase/endonuclease V n=1 Tax=Lysinibacillus sp. KU-BSD001 TaxID=3141328 RepID=UPI0036E33733